MAYGEKMTRLNPCSPTEAADIIASAKLDRSCILDMGCGRGDTLALLDSMFPDASLYGAEPDEQNAAAAQQACPRAEITVCFGEETPFGDESFDAVICECVFSLMSDREHGASEISRILKHGGILILSDMIARRECDIPLFHDTCGTIGAMLTRKAIEDTVTDAGFRILEFRDKSEDLLTLAAQMIFDGSFCECLAPETAAMMRGAKTGYGFWVFEKK